MKHADRARALDRWAERIDPSGLVDADPPVMARIAELAAQRIVLEDELAARVRDARRQGRSWSQIGAMLGVSKQAAQRKYAGRV